MKRNNKRKEPRTSIDARFLEIANDLKDRRQVNSLKDLFEQINVNYAQLWAIQNGLQSMTVVALATLAEKFSVNPIYLLLGSGPMYKQMEDPITGTTEPVAEYNHFDHDKLRKRIFEAIDAMIKENRHKSLNAFCKQHGLVYSTVKGYETERSTRPTRELIDALQDEMVRKEFLFTGETPIFQKSDTAPASVEISLQALQEQNRLLQEQVTLMKDYIQELKKNAK